MRTTSGATVMAMDGSKDSLNTRHRVTFRTAPRKAQKTDWDRVIVKADRLICKAGAVVLAASALYFAPVLLSLLWKS